MYIKNYILPLFITLAYLFSPIESYAQDATELNITIPKHYTIYKTNDTIVVDGKADEEVWKNALWTDEFIDIQGNDMPKPRFSTKVKMLWDNSFIYFYAVLEEPHIWGDITKRDAVIFHNNDFEIFIKPNQFYSHYTEFEVNVLKTLWELMLFKPYRLSGPITNHWDINDTQIGVHVEGTLNNPSDVDKYWAVEMAIPISAMNKISRYNPVKGGTLWRINFSRVQWQHDLVNEIYSRKRDTETDKIIPEDNWVWTPQQAIDMHRPEHWGYLQFSDKAPNRETTKLLDPWALEYQLLFYLHRKQVVLRKRNGAFAKDIKELGGPIFRVNGKNYTAFMENTLNGYTLNIRNEKNEILILNDAEQLSIIKQ